jgi:hypothetical protein
MSDFILAFSFFAFIEALYLLITGITVKGVSYWEKSRGHNHGNGYLIGVILLLISLVLDSMLLIRRKGRSIKSWDLTHQEFYSWYMPIIWFFIAVIVCACLACLYLSIMADTPAEHTEPRADLGVVSFSNDRLNFKEKFEKWGMLEKVLLFYALVIIALIAIVVAVVVIAIITALISFFGTSFIREITYLWVFIGALVLSLILIMKGMIHWEKSKYRSVRYSYLAGATYLLITMIFTFNLLVYRESIIGTPSKYWLSVHWLFLPSYWIIFSMIVSSYLVWLFYKEVTKKRDFLVSDD